MIESESRYPSAPRYAHTVCGQPPETWEPLEDHLEHVASRAAGLAGCLDAADWGQLVGLWHDLGKYAPQFQAYLKTSADRLEDDLHRVELQGRRVVHSEAGALHAVERFGPLGYLLAYCIAGHHSGLPDTVAADGGASGLSSKIKQPRQESLDALRSAPRRYLDQNPPTAPPIRLTGSGRNAAFQVAFFVRMLFSCLVDADFLETERFMDHGRSDQRPVPSNSPSPGQLATTVDRFIDRLAAVAQFPPSNVNRQRTRVLQACRDAAGIRPGFFSLTVPTGGGKTFSSLSFALRHATQNDLRRVIVAIPFTSIIEQNAAEYRKALGDLSEHVLEHHCNLDPRRETEHNRLAAENWDAPLIVTTNVQLLESLFASKPGRCRKLHHIARSVIVLDEAQALSPNLLAPTLAALRELVDNYGCSIVLCTATQPALEKRDEFEIGIEDPHPIIPESLRDDLFVSLKRVEIDKPVTLTDEELVDRLVGETRVLCIVNTRGHAAELFTALLDRLPHEQNDSCFHLSANMCPRHRMVTLWMIKRRLNAGKPCRVISTQLVEAGVDVDFPAVYRAMAGLDSIAQAAGRCNREGRLKDDHGHLVHGRVVVFEPADARYRSPGFLRQALNRASQVVPDHDDLLSPAAIHHYFRLHYWDEGQRTGWDRPPGASQDEGGVIDCFRDAGECMQFREAAQRYRLIVDDQDTVLIPFGRQGRALLGQLKHMADPPGRAFWRRLQRYTVGVRQRDIDRLLESGTLLSAEQGQGRWVLGNPAAYDCKLGLTFEAAGLAAEGLIV